MKRTMKHMILTLLLIFSTYVLADKQAMTVAEQSQQSFKKWEHELNEYLIDHTNADISVTGLYHKYRMLSIEPNEDNQVAINKIVNVLDDIVSTETLQPQSLILAYNICARDALEYLCDVKLIIKKLIQKAPQNMMVYIYDLKQAVIENDQPKIKSIIDAMAKSTSSRSYFYISKDLEEVIENYAVTHPFVNNDFVQEIMAVNGVSEQMINNMLNNPEKYQLFTVKMAYKLSLPTPAFNSLVGVCSEVSDMYKPCLKIAETMINNGDTIIGMMIGYSIKSEVYKFNEMHPQAKEAKIDLESFRKEYHCISSAMYASQHSMDNLFDTEFLVTGTKKERLEGEYANIIKMAELNYQQQLELGYEKAIDPETCFEK